MSKLPQHLLRPPEEYIDGHIKRAFDLSGFGGIPLWTQSGCTIFVNAESSLIDAYQQKGSSVELKFEEVDGVPLIWFDLLLSDNNEENQSICVFLNILDEQSVSCLQALSYQRWIVIHWYDEDREHVTSSAVEWSSENQRKAKEVTTKARQVIETTGGGDFEEAKAQITGENPPS